MSWPRWRACAWLRMSGARSSRVRHYSWSGRLRRAPAISGTADSAGLAATGVGSRAATTSRRGRAPGRSATRPSGRNDSPLHQYCMTCNAYTHTGCARDWRKRCREGKVTGPVVGTDVPGAVGGVLVQTGLKPIQNIKLPSATDTGAAQHQHRCVSARDEARKQRPHRLSSPAPIVTPTAELRPSTHLLSRPMACCRPPAEWSVGVAGPWSANRRTKMHKAHAS